MRLINSDGSLSLRRRMIDLIRIYYFSHAYGGYPKGATLLFSELSMNPLHNYGHTFQISFHPPLMEVYDRLHYYSSPFTKKKWVQIF